MYQNRRKIRTIYLLLDVFLIWLSFYLSYRLNPELVPQDLSAFKTYAPVFAFWGMGLLFLLHNHHLYITDRSLSIIQESWKIVQCVLLSSVLAALIIFVLKIDIFSRLVFIESTGMLLITISTWRMVKRVYVRHLVRQGYSNYNVLIVGAGRTGFELAEQIHSNPYLGMRIIGFLDDTKTKGINGYKVIGKIADLEEVVKNSYVDEIYVTIPSERKVTSEVILKGAKLKRAVRIVAEHFDLPYRQVGLNYVGFIPLVTYLERDLHGSEQVFKRMLDASISGALLILLSPLFVVISFLIVLESPGSVFYISKRCGRKGIVFNFYKFRSMSQDADVLKDGLRVKSEVDGPIFKMRNDPRMTKVGRVLRRYSLDELPQLFNVLRGEMSLIGPRPFPVEESEKVENKYISRLNIKPGITGLAQISGRSDLSFRHWARWDTWYINNWSLGLDLKILWRTVPVVLKAKGAY